MRVAAGILTWNAISKNRVGLLERTYDSIQDNNPDVLVVADNGSTDGTGELVGNLSSGVLFPTLPGWPHGNTCGYGMNKLAATLAQTDADVVVLSNDDMVWKPGTFDTLRQVWAAAPDDLMILSGLVEATFALPGQPPWNDPIAVDVLAGVRVLYRRSVPGGAWTFRNENYKRIFPVSTFPGVDDVPACHRLISEGFRVACTDLAAHAGQGVSTWGNGSDRFTVDPIEQVVDQWF